jgi:drug/metabolite transporter (DMT)-like permease
MLFESFVLAGPRLAMLLMSLVPIMSAFLGWVFLRESLNLLEIGAISLTVGGILWVVIDKRKDVSIARGRDLTWGILLGIGGALGQTFGLVLSKKGLEGGFSALSGNVIRILCAVVVIWLLSIVRGSARRSIRSYGDRKALLALAGGSFFGPFIGVWLSLVAIKYARLGIATTLMAVTPIFLIPITRVVFKERITILAVLGTIIAIAGVAILLLTGQK